MLGPFKLGAFNFQIQSQDQNLGDCISALLEKITIDADSVPLSTIDIDFPLAIVNDWNEVVAEASGLEIVRLIVRRALNHHKNYLWFDAATLVSPTNKTVLLAGPSHSGKSTAATALSFGYGWKLLAEDVSLVDIEKQKIITFSSPLSLRAGSLERIQIATGIKPGPVIGEEWIPIKDYLCNGDVDFVVDVAITFGVTDGSFDKEFQAEPVSMPKLVHTLLPLCNAIHLNNGVDFLETGLAKAECFTINGGSLSQRLSFIRNQVGERP